jgi:hypothetical protein
MSMVLSHELFEQGVAGPILNEPKRAYTILYAHSQPLMFQTHGFDRAWNNTLPISGPH